MGFFSGIGKIVASPLRGAKEVYDDVSEKNGEDSQFVSLATLGTSSVLKGTAKGIKQGIDDIFED